MNWKDTVNQNIEQWPTLFLRDTWERSEFDIAHHYFIVLGNGLEWANTKDPSKGGYLISPRNHRYQGCQQLPDNLKYLKKVKIFSLFS